MKYALVIYNDAEIQEALSDDETARIRIEITELLERPSVVSWVRLHETESATTVRCGDGQTLLTDGPFVDSKEYLGGLIIVEAANLDEALARASEFQAVRAGGAIEVRPILEAR